MSKGFGMLTSLKELNLNSCVKLESLPESESLLTSHFLISNFGNLMSKGFEQRLSLTKVFLAGFNQLRSLTSLDLRMCPAEGSMSPALKEQLNAQGCGI